MVVILSALIWVKLLLSAIAFGYIHIMRQEGAETNKVNDCSEKLDIQYYSTLFAWW